MALESHYDVLGVARSADRNIIRAAYRALAKRYHPDVATGAKGKAAARFRRIQEAYEVLSDARRRAEYNAQLNADALAADQRASQAPPFPWPPQEPSWTPQSQTTAPEGEHSARGRTSYVVWLISTILVITDVLAIKSWPDLSVPLIIFLFAIIILATRQTIEPNFAAAVIARRVYSALVLAYVGFVGLLLAVLLTMLAVMGIVAVAVGVGIMG
jgi:K+-sensing histidine kinase KdpD